MKSKIDVNEKNIDRLYHDFNYIKHHQAHEKQIISQVNASKHALKIRKTDFIGSSNETLKNKTLRINLPYMGHISLDNQKPRRGRKPKKSDICQLILKNYGINYEEETETAENVNEEPLNLCTKDSQIEKVDFKQKIIKCVRKPTLQGIKTVANNCPSVGMNKRKKNPKNLISEPSTSSNEVNICKFKFVNGFLRERTVHSFDRPVSVSSDSKMMKCDNDFPKKNQIKETHSSIKKENSLNNCKSFPIVYDSFVKNHKKLCNPFNQQEKKFEGKSFLIKTQEHLTPNESVYYKFRHLKKFTRYLLKNWKDYLPKNIEEKKSN